MVAAHMKFGSEARPSQYIVPFGNTEPTNFLPTLVCHYLDALWTLRVGSDCTRRRDTNSV